MTTPDLSTREGRDQLRALAGTVPTTEVIKDAVDDYAKPLKLLAQGLRFADPLTGEERFFESRIHLDW